MATGLCQCQRRRSYKQMVQEIADNLGSEDVQRIVYIHDLPREFGGKSGLEVLQHLERRGEVGERETDRLEELLQEIHRFDLVDKHLVQFRRRHGHHCCQRAGTSRDVPVLPQLSQLKQSKTPSLTVTPSDENPPSHTLSPSPSHTLTRDTEQSASTRLQPDEKRELRQLLARYVPLEVIRGSKLWTTFSFPRSLRLTKSTEYVPEERSERDGGCVGLKPEVAKHRSASMSKLEKGREEEEDLEWVVLDEASVTDSGTCSGSGSSLENESSLDIDIGDISPAQYKSKKQAVASEKVSRKNERRYFTWRVKRSEFMIPLFQHTNKTFEKHVKLCMGHKSHCLPIHFKLFPNGVGSDENIYCSFRISLPSASQLVPAGTSLIFSISVRDMRTADILATRFMEVGLEREEYQLEQFLAHEVIKSSQARHFEIRVMTKISTSSRGWVGIQPRKS